jgi:hypothetical protein
MGIFHQDYRRRFLDAEPSCHAGHVEDSRVHVPNRVSIDRRAAENDTAPANENIEKERALDEEWQMHEIPKTCQVTSQESALTVSSVRPTVSREQSSTTNDGSSSAPSSNDSTGISQPLSLPPKELPFKDECMRVVATFLRPSSSKELNLDATIRDAIIRDLAQSTHPDVVSMRVTHAKVIQLSKLPINTHLVRTCVPRSVRHARND